MATGKRKKRAKIPWKTLFYGMLIGTGAILLLVLLLTVFVYLDWLPDKRHDQDGQLDAKVFHSILEIGCPQQAYDMHEIEGNQENGGFVLEETGEFCFNSPDPFKRGSKGIDKPDED